MKELNDLIDQIIEYSILLREEIISNNLIELDEEELLDIDLYNSHKDKYIETINQLKHGVTNHSTLFEVLKLRFRMMMNLKNSGSYHTLLNVTYNLLHDIQLDLQQNTEG